jgi:hypothetical protein
LTSRDAFLAAVRDAFVSHVTLQARMERVPSDNNNVTARAADLYGRTPAIKEQHASRPPSRSTLAPSLRATAKTMKRRGH